MSKKAKKKAERKARAPLAPPKRTGFEKIASCTLDSVEFTVGLDHHPHGPAEPVIRWDAGAFIQEHRPHHADLPSMVEMLQALCDRFPQQPFEREIEWTKES